MMEDLRLLPAPQFRHVERHVRQFLIAVAGLGAHRNAAVGPVMLVMVPVQLDQAQRLRRLGLDHGGGGGGDGGGGIGGTGDGGRSPTVGVLLQQDLRTGVLRRLVRDRGQDVRLREPRLIARRLGTVRAQRIAGDGLQAQTAAGHHAV